MDTLSPKERSERMARVRGRNTGPERTVRSVLFSLGYRFRLHAPDLPGRPDIVLSSRQSVIFVHGCFWHRHNCRNGRRLPKSRVAFWQAKLESNSERDRRNRDRLRRAGWRVLVVWECQLRDNARLIQRLNQFLNERPKA
jgi:DNA mismatch endonuclease (patch repair protein)